MRILVTVATYKIVSVTSGAPSQLGLGSVTKPVEDAILGGATLRHAPT